MRIRPVTRPRTLVRKDKGQVTVELIGMLPYILLVFFMTIEAFAYIMTVEQVDSAARAAARVEAGNYGSGGGRQAAYKALPEILHDDHTRVHVYSEGSTAHAEVTARVPQLLGLPVNWTVTREAHIPLG